VHFQTFQTKIHDTGLKNLLPFRPVPSRPFAMASTKNMKNNPMHSSEVVAGISIFD
jgi:hypothetical protein